MLNHTPPPTTTANITHNQVFELLDGAVAVAAPDFLDPPYIRTKTQTI
ncbi:MAG: hypothetical protein ACRD4B_02670 [Acidobacteriota bacterium]